MALIGFAIAGSLALYQWRILPDVWEPFFGDGSRVILDSPLSHILPVPDAALGAMGYLVDAITGAIGGRRRWRTMPWMVVLFGLAVGPLGAASILLVILQPVAFGAWCTLCLASAALSILLIGPSMDEVLASLQELRRVHERGGSVWRAFWGKGEREADAPAAAPAASTSRHWLADPGAWIQVAGVALGIWLMGASAVLGYGGAAATSDRIVGPIAASLACVAIWLVLRPLRRLNAVLGLWLIAAPWVLGYASETAALASGSITGALLIATALLPGRHSANQGGGWLAVVRREEAGTVSAATV